jgi:hypothetical protein
MSIVKNALQAMERLSMPDTVKKARKAANEMIKVIRDKRSLETKQNSSLPDKDTSDF